MVWERPARSLAKSSTKEKLLRAATPISVVWGPSPLPIFVANGNNDSISVLDSKNYAELRRIDLDVFAGIGRRICDEKPSSSARAS
jgi:hypothetical protein